MNSISFDFNIICINDIDFINIVIYEFSNIEFSFV